MKPNKILLSAAFVVTLLNCLKPLHIDDHAYYLFAAQITAHPLDPYGFEVTPGTPALHILAPPVVPYWWASALWLFGHNPVCWKLWLLPFAVVMAFSLHAILRRFARGLETPLTLLTMLSPACLPSWNLMLDLPALALGLLALNLFFRGVDACSWTGVIGSGLCAGLAMQTKYTMFVVPALMLIYAVCFRRLGFGLLSASSAAAFFLGLEAIFLRAYGESHFLYSLHQRDGQFWYRVAHLSLPLLNILGGIAAPWALLGLAALRRSRWLLAGAASLFFLGYLALTLFPARYDVLLRYGKNEILLNNAIFGLFGAIECVTAAALVWRLGESHHTRNIAWWRALGPTEIFLISWLVLEIAGYFVLSPFAAVRRVLGILMAATVVAGRVASQTCASKPGLHFIWGSTLASALLGIAFFLVDLHDARAAEKAVAKAVRRLRGVAPEATVWGYGSWGFQYYAERAGMKPAGRDVRTGDWVVLGDQRYAPWPGDMDRLEIVTVVRLDDPLPLRTVPCYYGGRTPLEHRDEPRYSASIYRVR
jgi:hypothetical protein